MGHLETTIAIACWAAENSLLENQGSVVRKCRNWIVYTYLRSLTENKGETWLMAHQASSGQGRYLWGDRKTCISLCQKRDIKTFPVLDEPTGILSICFILWLS